MIEPNATPAGQKFTSNKSFNEFNITTMKTLEEQRNWVKDQLAHLWGDENMADYFVNPNRTTASTKKKEPSRIDDYIHSSSSSDYYYYNQSGNKGEGSDAMSSKLRKMKKSLRFIDQTPDNARAKTPKHSSGLFAHQIWHHLRESSDEKSKQFDLNAELKKTLNRFVDSSKLKPKRSKSQEEDIDREKDVRWHKMHVEVNTDKIKNAKLLRNEIELMFRSSKMNEERVGILKELNTSTTGNNPLAIEYYDPSQSDDENEDQVSAVHYIETFRDPRESIVKYLADIDLNEAPKPIRVNSSLELLSSQAMKEKYKRELEKKLALSNDNVVCDLIDTNSAGRNKVRLEFLDNVPYQSYLDRKPLLSKREDTKEKVPPQIGLNRVVSRVEEEDEEVKNSTRMAYYDPVIHTPKTTPHRFSSKLTSAKINETVNKNLETSNTLEVTKEPPPLTMNALMEYKHVINAPGRGEFFNGRPRFFKM